MSFNISISIKNRQFTSFREYYDEDTIEDAAQKFKDEVIEKRDSIHQEVLDD